VDAARAKYVARITELLTELGDASGQQADFCRDWLNSELARAAEIDEIARPLVEARAQARQACEAASAAIRSANDAFARSTTEDQRDRAELARIKASRALASANDELAAANERRAPPPKPPWADLPALLYQVYEETERLAKHAPALAKYGSYTEANDAITIATYHGQHATLSHMRLWALAERKFTDRLTRQLLAYRWLLACRALGISCDDSKLDLPKPVDQSEAVKAYERSLSRFVPY